MEDVKKFEQSMKQMDKKVDIVIYPDAGHGFENPNNEDWIPIRRCRGRLEADGEDSSRKHWENR